MVREASFEQPRNHDATRAVVQAAPEIDHGTVRRTMTGAVHDRDVRIAKTHRAPADKLTAKKQ
jgi:hypothetical protein